VLKHDRSELDYFSLVKKARTLKPGAGQPLRVALLADVSTQHLAPILRALFASHGVDAEVYEGGYDAVELEAFNPASGLYASQPQVVVVLQSTQKLKAAWYDFAGERAAFARARASACEEVWKAILGRTRAHVVQSTFVLPCERPFGNFGLTVTDTLQNAVRELNRELALRACQVPGVLLVDVDQLASWIGRRSFLDEKLWALSKSLCALEHLPDVAQNVVDVALAASGRTVKCVVLDLDNTLWGGVVGDDGLEGIGLGDLDEGGAFRSFQHYLRELSRRGIILAVCSKNDEAVARRVFQEHPAMVLKEEHIAVFVANWDDKATNLRRIRDALRIGFDAMVFLDDNPFERNLVRRALPEVIVPELPEDPALYVRFVSELNLFETASASALDAQRNVLYQDQARRDAERGRFEGIEAYLESLDTAVAFRRFESRDLPRIAQLVQRSNQFNLTTRRHSEAECAAMMQDEGAWFPFTLTVQDRFGDFGLVLVAVLRRAGTALDIDTFLMSCRVLQRGVEQHAINKIFDYARSRGFERVTGRFIPTAKNGLVREFFPQFGFERIDGAADGTTIWSLAVDAYVPKKVFIREILPPSPEAAGGVSP
jgi:FkbH-like protein